MTAAAHPIHRPGPRSGSAAFDAACARRDYALLQDAICDMPKRDAVQHLAALFPARTERWFARNLPRLMALTPDDFARTIDHADPTGDTAVRRVMADA